MRNRVKALALALSACRPCPRGVQDRRAGSRDIAVRVAADPGQVANASASLDALMCTPRSKLSRDGRRRFWVEMCEAPTQQPFPLTPCVVAGAAVLRVAGYRSARLYLVEAKIEHERRGSEVTSMLQHAITNAVRAVQRSLGPAGKQAKFDVTEKHPTKRRPLEPAARIHAWSFASAFLLRDVELCCLTLVRLAGFCQVLGHAAFACFKDGPSR